MADRRIFINERVDTVQVKKAAGDLVYYDLEVIRRYQKRVNGYNAALQPLPESTYVGLAFGKHGLPPDFKKDWKKTEQDLIEVMMDIKALKHPNNVLRALLRRFQYTQSLVSIPQALGFLNLSEARLRNLESPETQAKLPSVTLASFVFMENMILRGAFFGSTFFIPVERPITDRRVHLQDPSQAFCAIGIVKVLDDVRKN